MSVSIRSNMSALQAQRRLGEATASLAKTFGRLSSGLRITRASDDAAGLAISKTLELDAIIFTQGIRNLNDGISYTSMAAGAVKELKSILYRQRELSTQSSNGTYSNQQREALEVELKELSAEWNRVLDSTAFNGRNVFSVREGILQLQAGHGANAVFQAVVGSREAAAQDDIRLASTASAGTQGDDVSSSASISADGRYVAFQSKATNLVLGDTNGKADIFVEDLQTGAITRVSTGTQGVQANNSCYSPVISADGRYVTFSSSATNLVSGDTNGKYDTFVKDLRTGEITRASVGLSGAQANGDCFVNSMSADGRYVAFYSDASTLVGGDTNGTHDIFVKDLQTGAITRATTDSSGGQANSSSFLASLSADGRYVAFRSDATNLVADDTNGLRDIFVKDLQTGAITRASTTSSGGQANNYSTGPMLSADGRYVAFSSPASNLVAGDTNFTFDIFVKDLQTGETTRANTTSSGGQASGSSPGCAISGDGRYVAFITNASNLVAGDTNGKQDIFVKDLHTAEIVRISTDSSGGQADNDSSGPVFSADGRYVAFQSTASNLVTGDTNGKADIFATGNPFAEWSHVSRNQWLSVATREEALNAQGMIDNSLTELNSIEGALGAVQARLETAVESIRSMTENYRAAESRITDADMGQDAANFTRTKIVQLSAISVLAQANQQPNLALTLLQ